MTKPGGRSLRLRKLSLAHAHIVWRIEQRDTPMPCCSRCRGPVRGILIVDVDMRMLARELDAPKGDELHLLFDQLQHACILQLDR